MRIAAKDIQAIKDDLEAMENLSELAEWETKMHLSEIGWMLGNSKVKRMRFKTSERLTKIYFDNKYKAA
jgi:hypothetical protein